MDERVKRTARELAKFATWKAWEEMEEPERQELLAMTLKLLEVAGPATDEGRLWKASSDDLLMVASGQAQALGELSRQVREGIDVRSVLMADMARQSEELLILREQKLALEQSLARCQKAMRDLQAEIDALRHR